MNILFALLFLASAVFLLFHSPDLFLSALLEGGGKAASTCVALVATYSVWLGLMRVWEDSGVARGMAKLVKPIARRLLKTEDEGALQAASMNFSVNLLGISGAGTPYGIRTANLLDGTENAEYSSAILFVLNATSLQILPASLVAVRVAMGSAAPTDIILPTMLASLFSTLAGVFLVWLFLRPKKSVVRRGTPVFSYPQRTKTEGVRTQ